MKTPLLLALLALSLAGNVALALRRHAVATPDVNAGSAAATSTAGDAAGSPAQKSSPSAKPAAPVLQPVTWTAPAPTSAALRAYADELRRAGFPPRVVAQIVSTLLRDHALPTAYAGLPFWRLQSNDPKYREQTFALQETLQRQLEEILGADGTPAALLDPAQRAQRFGSLPDPQVNALLRIERDYQELTMKLNSVGPTTVEEMSARTSQLATIEQERLADIRAALTPEQFAAWELRSSGVAQRVQNAARNLTLTEEEYRAIYAAQQQFEPNASLSVMSSPTADPRIPERLAMLAQVRTTLGEERFDTYLRGYDFNYANTAAFADQQGGLTKAQTYSLYQLQLEAQAALTVQGRAIEGNGRPDFSATQKTMTQLNARLEELLGAATADAYRKSSAGAYFGMFRPSSSPARPAQPAQPSAQPATPLPKP